MSNQSLVNVKSQYKVVLLGDFAVGKSSIASRFVQGQFSETHEITIGASFLTQTVRVDDAIVKFDIWVDKIKSGSSEFIEL